SSRPPGLAPFGILTYFVEWRSDAALSRLPVLRPDLALEDLPIGVLGYRRDELHRFRLLVARDVLPAEVDDLLLGGAGSALQDHDGLHRLAPHRVGDPDHRDLLDRRVPQDDLFDLPGVDVGASADYHVLHPVHYV